MKMRARCALFVTVALAACALPAYGADRSAGATIPKPAASGAPWTDAARAALTTDLDALLSGAATLRGAHVGIVAVDVRDGAAVYVKSGDDAFMPASTAKLVTGSAALDLLGAGFHFQTQAYVDTPIAGGMVPGGVRVRGNGDVTLDERALDEFAAAARAAGITAANVIADIPPHEQRLLPGWVWDDLLYDYAAGVESLGYNHNVVRIHVVPAAHAGAPAVLTIEPFGNACVRTRICRPLVGFAIWNDAMTGPVASVSSVAVSAGDDGLGALTVSGAIAAGAPPEDIDVAVAHPTRFFEAAAAHAFAAARIAAVPYSKTMSPRVTPADGSPAAAQRIIWTHDSEALNDLVADMWLPSDNLLAEELLRALGSSAQARVGTSDDGIARVNAWLKTLGIDPAAVSLRDGSGLSVYDRLSPAALVTVLQHDWNGPYRAAVLDDLPIAGVRGTLGTAFKGTAAEGRVFAKTGSMSYVNALAGYIATRCHGTLAFAFLVDDWLGSSADLRETRVRVLTRLIDAPC